MSEAGPGGEAPRSRALRGRWPGFVWAVPAAALMIVGYLGLRAYTHAGVDVVVSFASAGDAKPGDTQVVYRGLDVGRVTHVGLGADGRGVDMRLRLSPKVKPLLRRGTTFWIVGAKPSLTDLNSLKAAVAGVNIGMEPGGGPPARRFRGLDQEPAVLPGTPGSRYVLQTTDVGSTRPGAQVYYHGLEVGRVTRAAVEDAQDSVVEIFVLAPYDRLVRQGTEFFSASALRVSLSGAGFSTQLAPASAALGGGVEFDTSAAAAATPRSPSGSTFRLYPDRARADGAPRGPEVLYDAELEGPVGELDVGAPVRMDGFQIGTVKSRSIRFDSQAGEMSTPLVVALEPERLWPGEASAGRAATDARVARLAAHGHRLRLAQSPPVVGGRVLTFDRVAGAPAGRLAMDGARPRLPGAPAGDVNDVLAKADAILGRVEQVPIEAIGQDVRRITARVSQLVSSPKLQDSLDHLDSTLTQVDQTMREVRPKVGPLIDKLNRAADEIQATAASARETLSGEGAGQDAGLPGAVRELTDAARAVRALADYLGLHPEAVIRGKRPEGR